MNRRLFLKNASLATAGMLYSSNLFAQAKQMRDFEKNPMNLAFVGTGLMGGQNMRIFLNTMKQNCVAVCDVDGRLCCGFCIVYDVAYVVFAVKLAFYFNQAILAKRFAAIDAHAFRITFGVVGTFHCFFLQI